MDRSLLLGVWRTMLRLPRPVWQNQVAQNARAMANGQEFLSGDVARVRNYVVVELPRAGAPLSPQRIAANLDLPVERVVSILAELEKGMTFLYRDEQGCVAWAYPVTVERTPHRVRFSSGEQLYAA
jgi:hypothetical protein